VRQLNTCSERVIKSYVVEDNMPVLVNKVEITDDEVHAEMQHHPAKSVDSARDLAAEALVIRELLFQEAVRLKLSNIKSTKDATEAEIASVIDKLLEQEISIPEADNETCQHYYEQHKESFADKKSGSILPFDLVQKHIQDYIHDKAMRVAVRQYIEKLTRAAKIAGFNMLPQL